MSKKYVYADPHFSHANIIKYESRPFSNTEEMNKEIIKSHNSIVTKRDKIFILGDFCLASREKIFEITKQLNGYKILIMGNHDRGRSINFWRDMGFDEVSKYPIIIDNFFILSHEPLSMTEFMPYLNVHGHIHSYKLNSDKHFNVSLDVTDFKPKLFEDLILEML